ncbi:MAG: energy transducer TonB [Bdellovibrionales bacterium]|nr:energy transducer TonB [Bdellovibrionales bacterium]
MKTRLPSFRSLLVLSCLAHSAAFAVVDLDDPPNAPVKQGDLTVKLVPIQEHAPKEEVVEEVPPPPPPPPPKEPVRKQVPKPKPPEQKKIDPPRPPAPKPQTAPPPPQYPAPVEAKPQHSATALPPAIRADYEAQLLAWLERHKRYPRSARRRGLEGEALILIRISRTGEILFSAIERSSGAGVLDTAVEQMITRSNPFPPMPETYPGRDLEFRVPVRFELQ